MGGMHLRQFKFVTIAQLIAWTLFTISEYIEETFSNSVPVVLANLIIPSAAAILYLIFKGMVHNSKIAWWANTLYVLGVWFVETYLMTVLIMTLLLNDKWIVHQKRGGWENFQNGFEYNFFSFFLGYVPIIITFLWYLLSFLGKALIQITVESKRK